MRYPAGPFGEPSPSSKIADLSGGSFRSNPLNRDLRLDAAWRANLPGVPGR